MTRVKRFCAPGPGRHRAVSSLGEQFGTVLFLTGIFGASVFTVWGAIYQ